MNIDLINLEDSVRLEIASSAFVSTEVLSFLSLDKKFYVRARVASNQKSTHKILDRLSKDKVSDVRFKVAENPSTPAEILDYLSHDKAEYVRFGVAQNKNTSSETLDYLSHDKHENVRSAVAINENTSSETLVALSEDKSYKVRYFVSQNENTPKGIRKSIKRYFENSGRVGYIKPSLESFFRYEDPFDDFDYFWLNQWIANSLRKWIIGYHIFFKISDYLYCNLSKIINWLIFVSITSNLFVILYIDDNFEQKEISEIMGINRLKIHRIIHEL